MSISFRAIVLLLFGSIAAFEYGEGDPTCATEGTCTGEVAAAVESDGTIEFDTANASYPCTDDHENCEYWAGLEPSECDENPTYMNRVCRKSCKVCEPTGEEDESLELPSIEEDLEFDLGEPQTLKGPRAYETRDLVEKTIEYMRNEVFVDSKYEKVKDNCKNYHQKCAIWALTGECEANPRYMTLKCAPSCFSCDKIDYSARCPMDDLGPDAFGPGDVNKMFEKITSSEEFKQYNPQILSRPKKETKEEKKGLFRRFAKVFNKNKGAVDSNREATEDEEYQLGPWVVTLNDFVSPEECERLIALGAEEGYYRSVEVGEIRFDGTAGRKIHGGRTSTNAWCQNSCYEDPVAKVVMERIANLTGIPETNAEYLQLLKYEEQQHYGNHHDLIEFHRDRQSGVRMLTVYLYLNDVEEGGGTKFTDLNLTVYPKRGRALIWPSVLDSDPNEKDNRTHHQALPVEKGVKYGANAWVHQRDYKKPNRNNCM